MFLYLLSLLFTDVTGVRRLAWLLRKGILTIYWRIEWKNKLCSLSHTTNLLLKVTCCNIMVRTMYSAFSHKFSHLKAETLQWNRDKVYQQKEIIAKTFENAYYKLKYIDLITLGARIFMMECNVNATCICISYYSIRDTFFGNVLVLFVICFLWLSCWTVVCLTTVQKKNLYSTDTWYPAVLSSVRCWNILSKISLGYYILLSLYLVSGKIILGGFTVRFPASELLKCHTCLALIVLQCVELTHKPGLYLGGMEFARSDVWLMSWDCGKYDAYSGKFVFEKINPGDV